MTIGAFITITRPDERGDTFTECLRAAQGCCDSITLINGLNSWPAEFDWPVISQHFQAGYEQTDADWVLHLDTDFILHEADYDQLYHALRNHPEAPALSLWKRQFILPDRYNIKSRLVAAVNKARYGRQLRFNSGGDGCQPSLDNRYLKPDDLPEARVAIWNYEKLIKTEAQVRDDIGRMDRAWRRSHDRPLYGAADAYAGWLQMVTGRFRKPQEHIALTDHPSVMQATISNLRPEQWGYDGFGHLEANDYA